MWEKIKSKAAAVAAKLGGAKRIWLAVAVLAIAVMLLIYFGSSCFSSENAGINGEDGEYDYCAGVVKELETKLSGTEGVGDVSVMIYWKDVVTEDGETVREPEGVIIVCDGGNDIAVKMRLIMSVAAYLGIDEDKVNVLAKGD